MSAFGYGGEGGVNSAFGTSGIENDPRVPKQFSTVQINHMDSNITRDQWEHVSNLDQDISNTSDVVFNSITLSVGATADEISIDGTFAGDSDSAIPTEKATAAFVASAISAIDTFLKLPDTPSAFTTPNAIYRVNAAGDAVEESATLLLEPASDRFSLSSGTTAFTVTGDCTINQNLSSGSSVAHAKLFLTSASTPQLSVRYDATHLLEVSVDASGNATINPSGGELIFNSKKINMYESSQIAILATDAAPAVTDASIAIWSDDNSPSKYILCRRTDSNTAGPPVFKLQKSSGTVTAPTAIASGTILGMVDYNGHDGDDFQTNIGASIRANATELWDGTSDVHGTKLRFYINPTAVTGLIQNRAEISADASYTYLKLHGSHETNSVELKASPTGDFSIAPSGGDVDIVGTLTLTSGTSVNKFSTDGTLAGDSDDTVPTEKATKSYVDNLENGFLDRDDSVLTYNSTLNELTVTPAVTSFEIVSKYIRYTISSPDTLANAGTDGTYFYYYINNTLTVSTSIASLFDTVALVAVVVLNSAGDLISLGDERHGVSMDWQTHKYLHDTLGTQYSSGVTPSVVIGDGSLATHAQVATTAGVIYDEDIRLVIDAISMGDTVTLLYRDGASDWLSLESAFYIYKATNRLYYNSEAAGSYSITEVSSNNRYTLTHLFATNDVESKRKVVAIMGQAEYSTLGAARDGASTEIQTLNIGGLPAIEWTPIATILLQTSTGFSNAVAARVVQTATGEDFVDWRSKTITSAGSASNHSSLSGLLNDDHTQYATLINRGGETLDVDTIQLLNGTSANEISIDGTLAGDSDDALPTEKAVKTYIDTERLGDISMTGPSSISTLADDMYLIPAGGNVGVNITKGSALTSALEVNAADGECFRLIYNDADGAPTSHTYFKQTSGGDMYLYPSGGEIGISGKLGLAYGTGVNEFSLDGTLAGNSYDAVPTEAAVKTYCDNYIGFTSLSDAPVSFAQAYSAYRVNSTTNGIEESGIQITTPDTNELKITRGTSYIDVDDTICTINQDLDSGAAVDFAGMTLTNTTAPQLTVAYDATNKVDMTTDSSGNLNIDTYGNNIVLEGNEVLIVDDSIVQEARVYVGDKNYASSLSGAFSSWSESRTAGVEARASSNTINWHPTLWLTRSKGTKAVPLTVVNGDYLGSVNFGGYDGTDWNTGTPLFDSGVSIQAIARDTWTTASHPGRLIIQAPPVGAKAPATIVKLDSDNVVLTSALSFLTGTSVTEFSTDGTLAGDSDDAIPTEKAIKTYVDTIVPTFGATTLGCPAASNPWFVNTNIGYGYQKIGNCCILTVDEYFATSSGSGLGYILTGTVPAAIIPSNDIQAYIVVKDDGTDKDGIIKISSAGQITISVAQLGTSFTLGGGSTGNYAGTICYTLTTGTTAPV